ncbi:hypothetical protein GCM10010965_21830 [Caldalkalibacillus thermarum]|uniref:hypothetical protein n=1 Tax=Caldalkalibacillus thermarum TaxID=296745 RepID=UPI00166D2EFF|nr:hypothetical protein [Caldalkalibacillus thermarum]GGK28639.1 hypothetical protein GCM10010965_21830 [Caldalkalibacillus thermarum]
MRLSKWFLLSFFVMVLVLGMGYMWLGLRTEANPHVVQDYLEWFEVMLEQQDPSLAPQVIAYVGSESLTHQELWTETATQKIRTMEYERKRGGLEIETTLSEVDYQAAFTSLLTDLTLVCIAKHDKNILIEKEQAWEWNQRIIEAELTADDGDNPDIVAIAKLQRQYPQLFEDKWLRSYVKKELFEMLNEEHGLNESKSEEAANKISQLIQELLRDGKEKCAIKLTSDAPDFLVVPDDLPYEE